MGLRENRHLPPGRPVGQGLRRKGMAGMCFRRMNEKLKSFLKFFSEGALASRGVVRAARVGDFSRDHRMRCCSARGRSGLCCWLPRMLPGMRPGNSSRSYGTLGALRRCGGFHRDFASRFWRLGWIGTKKTILQGRSIKSPDYGVHLLLVGRFYKSEAL